MRKFLVTIVVLFLSYSTSFGQYVIRKRITNTVPADSLDLKFYSRKKGLEAASIVFGFNIGLLSIDHYILKGDYANVTFNSIRDNFKQGAVWDNDNMSTNMFAHPYTGGLYYNAARSNGYNYWQSMGASIGGSLMWEFAGECTYPSINDLFATGLGGTSIGEMTYRLSDLVLDDRKKGSGRVGSELACLCIAPTRELSRLINGQAWNVRKTSGRQFGTPSVSIDISSGIRVLELKGRIFDSGIGLGNVITIEYGDKFDVDDTKPYEYFSLRAQVNVQKKQPLLGNVNMIARLGATELINNKKDFLSLGAYQHFDYYNSDTISSVTDKVPFRFSAPVAFGGGIVYQNKRFSNWNIDSFAHLDAVILGTSLSDHYLIGNRNYNIGSGFGWKAGLNIAFKKQYGVSAFYEGYELFTWKGYDKNYDLPNLPDNIVNIQGDKSRAVFNTLNFKGSLKLSDKLYLTAIARFYYRTTHYSYFKTEYSMTKEGLLMLTYKW